MTGETYREEHDWVPDALAHVRWLMRRTEDGTYGPRFALESMADVVTRLARELEVTSPVDESECGTASSVDTAWVETVVEKRFEKVSDGVRWHLYGDPGGFFRLERSQCVRGRESWTLISDNWSHAMGEADGIIKRDNDAWRRRLERLAEYRTEHRGEDD